MAYEKQTWATGDVITAAKLNHMEDGIATANVEYDLELHLSITGTYDAPVLAITGMGLSVEELVEKIDNFERVLWSITVRSNFEGSEMDDKEYTYDEGYTIRYINNSGGEQLYLNNLVCIYINDEQLEYEGGLFDYTYDPSTKEYTFTPVGGGE